MQNPKLEIRNPKQNSNSAKSKMKTEASVQLHRSVMFIVTPDGRQPSSAGAALGECHFTTMPPLWSLDILSMATTSTNMALLRSLLAAHPGNHKQSSNKLKTKFNPT